MEGTFFYQNTTLGLLCPHYPRRCIAQGYSDVPQVERAITVHLCPQNTATWRSQFLLVTKWPHVKVAPPPSPRSLGQQLTMMIISQEGGTVRPSTGS